MVALPRIALYVTERTRVKGSSTTVDHQADHLGSSALNELICQDPSMMLRWDMPATRLVMALEPTSCVLDLI